MDRIKQFQDDYRTVVISDVLPNWSEILAEAGRCKASLVKSRQKGEQRHQDYDVLMAGFRDLVRHCGLLTSSRDELNKKINLERRDGRRFILTFMVTAAALLAALVFGMYPIISNHLSGAIPSAPAGVSGLADDSAEGPRQ